MRKADFCVLKSWVALAFLLFALTPICTFAQSERNLDYELIHQRGIEAVLWSMPAIADVYWRESLARDYGMKPGDVMVMSKPLVARHEVLTANNQVNYATMAFDLTGGPFVVDIPASDDNYAIIGEFCDNWQATITMVGTEGPDKGKGGKYLLLPPDYKKPVPKGYLPIQMLGYHGTMLYRPVIIGKGTMEGAVALARQTKTYPLSEAAAPKPTRVLDGWDKDWHSLPVYDIGWFQRLAQFVNDEPIRERDKVMIGMLSTLGIEKGKPFNPDAETTKALTAAIQDAYAIMQQDWVKPGKGMAPWWPDRQWGNLNPAYFSIVGKGWSFDTADAVWTYQRAIAPFFFACYMPIELGGQQMYLVGTRDSSGAMFSGTSAYRFRVPGDVPVSKFWSVIVYSRANNSFVPNPLNHYGLDSYGKKDGTLKTNSDGSVDIYLGNSAPKDMESNWIPSAGQDFFIFFRLYGPSKAVYDKSWKAPDIERIQ